MVYTDAQREIAGVVALKKIDTRYCNTILCFALYLISSKLIVTVPVSQNRERNTKCGTMNLPLREEMP